MNIVIILCPACALMGHRALGEAQNFRIVVLSFRIVELRVVLVPETFHQVLNSLTTNLVATVSLRDVYMATSPNECRFFSTISHRVTAPPPRALILCQSMRPLVARDLFRSIAS